MEERVEKLASSRFAESEARVSRLREDNARLTAQCAVLEERLKEVEARAERDIEAERSHHQALLVKT
ncbi:unnamed protein product [Protopolystoma xenopodis]|uniref:Rab11-FIP3/4 domain-containing protein n=1 Tax=Protopolystoma xenopodis TaxID=117903 RepID=A0A3S4ZW40_9PLAT|nr:unnamed protein product [Protopolystoma xenopodis]